MPAVPASGFPGEVQAIVQRAAHVTRLHYAAEMSSTNEEALTLARGGAPHGTLVLADRQSAGRGRQGRSWHSAAGLGLWFSWLLKPRLSSDQAFWVTAAAAVAVVEACARTAGVWATIKWPNDILIRGRKVCGLLAESGTLGDSLQFIVLGVGLNVNHKRSDFPPEIAGEATSLKEAGGHALDRALVLQAFIESFEPLYDRLEAGEVVHVRREWLARDGIMGRRVRITDPRSEFEGKAVDLAADGALIVERDRGGRVEVRAAEVRLVRDIEPEV